MYIKKAIELKIYGLKILFCKPTKCQTIFCHSSFIRYDIGHSVTSFMQYCHHKCKSSRDYFKERRLLIQEKKCRDSSTNPILHCFSRENIFRS